MTQSFPRAIGLGRIVATLGSTAVLGAVLEAKAVAELPSYNCRAEPASPVQSSPEQQVWCNRWQTLQNTTYQVPASLEPSADYISVTLSNGRYQQPGQQFIVEQVNQQGWSAFGDLNGDGKIDAAVILGVALDPEGKAVATYLSAVLNIDGTPEALIPVRLGERILLNGPLNISNGQIIVPLLTATEVINRAYGITGSTLSQLAQWPDLPDGTLALTQSSSYAVRVFAQNQQQPRLNLYHKATGKIALTAVPVTVEPIADGLIYRYAGEPAVQLEIANSGAQKLNVNGRRLQDYAEVKAAVTHRAAAPPSGAVIEIALVEINVAAADRIAGQATVLSAQSIILRNRQLPISFALLYDPKQINPSLSYAIQTRVTVDGQLRFASPAPVRVITQNHPTEVEVIVSPVSLSS